MKELKSSGLFLVCFYIKMRARVLKPNKVTISTTHHNPHHNDF